MSASAALLLVLGALPGAAQEQQLSLAEYRAELLEIAGALEAGAPEQARADAASLLAARFVTGGETLSPDVTLLAPLADTGAALRPAAQARALRRLAESLAAAGETALARTDPELLQRLAAEQTEESLQRGGKVDARLKPPTLSERLRSTLDAVGAWTKQAVDWLRELLRKLWPRRSRQGRSGTSVFSATTALVALIAALLVSLALRALRGRRAAPIAPLAEQAAAPARDDDPLSREAAEWERYAAELRAKGRLREALRAHYHAVLVALFRAGLLFHQKGRTNWEYVAQLAPELRFRPAFIEITRRFDSEWYGRQRTTPEALAEYASEAGRILRAVRAPEAAA